MRELEGGRLSCSACEGRLSVLKWDYMVTRSPLGRLLVWSKVGMWCELRVFEYASSGCVGCSQLDDLSVFRLIDMLRVLGVTG
jgi:hypothetical protein